MFFDVRASMFILHHYSIVRFRVVLIDRFRQVSYSINYVTRKRQELRVTCPCGYYSN